MPFSITRLDNSFPTEGKVYLFDANVWMFILALPHQLNAHELAYVNFFDAVVNLSSNPLCKNRPYIHLNGLIISEVYNAHMKSHWDAYKVNNPLVSSLKKYRLTDDFKANLKSIKSDFDAYLPYLKIVTSLTHSPETILFDVPSFSDYNDHYYYQIAKSNGYIIVTNDGDFRYENIEILTMNQKLLSIVE